MTAHRRMVLGMIQAGKPDGRLLIAVTSGNVRNSHISIARHYSFFPPDSFGRPRRSVEGASKPIFIELEGLNKTVETDIGRDAKTGKPRRQFRGRGWVREFFRHHRVQPGDQLELQRTSNRRYLLSVRDRTPPPGFFLAPSDGNAGKNGDNRLAKADRPAHNWFRFVLSYPPHLVRHYLQEFGMAPGYRVLDPFCGTGTTIVECRKNGIESVGIEPNRSAFLATKVKVDWSPNPSQLIAHAETIAGAVCKRLEKEGIPDSPGMRNKPKGNLLTLPDESMNLLLTDSISPLPLHKTLVLLEEIDRNKGPFHDHLRLALARALVFHISNLHFGPEVGVTKPKPDAAVVGPWLAGIREMVFDLTTLPKSPLGSVELHCADARDMATLLPPKSIDAVITSPPYPNEKDYTRTTRLESVILGFLHNKKELQALKHSLVRSNTRNVYKGDNDDAFVIDNMEIQRIANEIERRRIEMGKTSGFERMYSRVTRLYFGGMARHFAALRNVLKPGAHLAYVVGDQASYLRVMIRTGLLLADIATSFGYDVVKIDLFRTRLATATKEQLREEVLVLRWPGPKSIRFGIKIGRKANGK